MTDDLHLAYLGHVAQVSAGGGTERLFVVDLRNVERSQAITLFARRRAFKNQPFILVDVVRGFLDVVVAHWATACTAASICSLELSSVQHHTAALPSSG